MARDTGQTRAKILAAAGDLAREHGPGKLSLDAVAARAGVSKGGLLYHFASKSALMEGLVTDHLARLEAALRAGENTGRPDGVIAAYLAEFRRECAAKAGPPAGLLAALVEDPTILEPVRQQERAFLDLIRSNATDPDMATAAFLVVHGIRTMQLMNVSVLTQAEEAAVMGWIAARLEPPQD
ncbi:TetR/AcrR family transcriptional regulator [Roseicitreum antarcticum]|uniref:Transcriptional regulator, TetR family n=1 Tax=Roseicitreum antarcticum TaxID=564137 RepID=A0A1H2Z8X9_9RHOB|nr:TetR/AcrR family transcriptional regulator [Roseicitreum antarcticum]SDX13229.1 transcriptional regulator, TetR family [Roseicitreum antarcticum]